jgi:hypothetical protein
MASPVRYIIHPGWVKSASDGDLHYITAGKLMSLYQLNLRDPNVHYVIDRDGKGFGIGETPGDIHLYPRFDGNYSLPAKDKLRGEELRQELIGQIGTMSLKSRLLILLMTVAGLFRPGIVYTTFLTGVAQRITSDQQAAEAMARLMQELAKPESDEAGK